MARVMPRVAHRCSGARILARCTACDGRMHGSDCSTAKAGKLNPAKDCCPARHKQLHDNGQRLGISDSVPMWLPHYGEGRGEFPKEQSC